MKLIFSCLSLTLALSAHAETVANVTTAGFSQVQDALVRRAAKVAVDRMLSPQVVKCVQKNAKRARTASAAEWRFRDSNDRNGHLVYAMYALRDSGFKLDGQGAGRIDLHIAAEAMEGNTTGRASVGIVNGNQKKYSIRLNRDKVAGRDHLSSADMWAEVISHEMLHNVALRHGTANGANWDTNYKDFVITEWGFCVESNGANGSSGGFGLVGARPKYNN